MSGVSQLNAREEASRAPTVLRVEGLTTSFRTDGVWTPVVRDLSFEIDRQETVAIVGESGSGKSVTALSVMQLLPAANSRVDGTIELNGRKLLDLPDYEMRRVRGNDVAMIFQEPMTSLNPVLTIGFQVAEVLRYHRGMDRMQANKEALRLLDLVRIPKARSRFDDYPHHFSGGMRQRVMIAMALACEPSLLIADEPTTALDVTIQAQILDLIRMLQRDLAMSVMFITHDMGVVAEVADRVVVMYRGDKVEEGTARQIFESPEHSYTRSLLAAVPRLGSMRGKSAPERFEVLDVSAAELATAELPTVRTVQEPKARLEGRNADLERISLLKVAGLTTRFPIRSGVLRRHTANVHAVENVSFALSTGETLGLVGESGCGKSTVGRSILRLIEPTSGTIAFEGRDLLALDRVGLRAVRRDMQMIFQDPYASLNPRKMVGAAIAEPMLVHGIADWQTADDRVVELLRRVGLDGEHALRYPHEFSGGQRQRLCIARCLALNPKLIVADEAVSALDVTVQAQVINLMLELQQDLGLGYIFISHDMAVIERVSHRVAVMYLGQIVEIGPRAAVFDDPQHPYTKKLLLAVPVPAVKRHRREIRLSTDEIPSPIRPVDDAVDLRPYREASPGHFVREDEQA